MLREALKAAAMGFSVIPLHGINRDTRSCTCGNRDCSYPAKHPWIKNWRANATKDEKHIRDWLYQKPFSNYGIVTGAESGIIVLDADGGSARTYLDNVIGENALSAITGREGGLHVYLSHPGFDVRNATNVIPSLDVRGDGGYVVGPGSLHATGRKYAWRDSDAPVIPIPGEILEMLAIPERTTEIPATPSPSLHASSDFWLEQAITRVREGAGRNDTGFWIACQLRDAGASEQDAEGTMSLYVSSVPAGNHPYTTSEAVASVRQAYAQPARSEAYSRNASAHAAEPQGLAPEAFHGLAGEVVRAIEPHSESDPAALLFQFLTMLGNVLGRHAYFIGDGAEHYTNLFTVIVGASAKARKTSGYQQLKRVFAFAQPEWIRKNVMTGLGSGEGLIEALRDPVIGKREVKSENGETVVEDYISDHGVEDKRMLLVETEFAAILKKMKGERSIISNIIRQAWDGGDLQLIVRHKPCVVTAPHVSLIGHVTEYDLRQFLSETDIGNGFANRILWVFSKRSKILPEGGQLPSMQAEQFARRIRSVIDHAATVAELRNTLDARRVWHDMYVRLSEDQPGRFGIVTARAEPQVRRLACLFALCDLSTEVDVVHLRAAEALWKYAEDSARYVFRGKQSGLLDEIHALLRESPNGLSKTELYTLLGNNVSRTALDNALSELERTGRAKKTRQSNTGGRPAEIWTVS